MSSSCARVGAIREMARECWVYGRALVKWIRFGQALIGGTLVLGKSGSVVFECAIGSGSILALSSDNESG